MNPRIVEFIIGIEATAQPDAGTPTNVNDVLTLGFINSNLAGKRKVIGSLASPTSVTASGLTVAAGETYEHDYLVFVKGSSGAVDITANPQITHSLVVGDTLELRGCSDTDTLKLDNGNGLSLNSDSIVLKSGSIIRFNYNGSVLEEVSRNGIEG